MNKNCFKKLFLRNVYLISILVLGSAAFINNTNSDEKYENIKILIASSGGLQFSKEDSPEGRKIIYDCNLGTRNEGTIDIFDPIHGIDMRSLIIKNCYKITLQLPSNDGRTSQFQEVKISDVISLKLETRKWYVVDLPTDFKVSINNVQFLDVGNFFTQNSFSNLSLTLQNVVIDTLSHLYFGNCKLLNLHLKNVEVKKIERRAIGFTKNSNSHLIVEDSHFEHVDGDAFVFNGTVIIINSTFSFLGEAAFSINTPIPFVFSGNHIRRMLNPFYITGSEVNIINNTFDSIVAPWLPKIIEPETKSFRVLNITGNIIHDWSYNFFHMEPENFPDVIIFEDNYLNCSCKNALTLAYKFQNYTTEVFLQKQQKNFCHNLGNCPLYKALRMESGICSATFRCPEHDHTEDDENARMWPSHVKSILSVLKNIDTKLDHFLSKYSSSSVDKPNLVE